MSTQEALLQGGKKNCIGGVKIQVRMGRSLFAYFIAHTPVLHTGEAGQGGLDDLVGETMFNRIVEGQLILTRFGLSQNHTFLKLHKTRGWQRVILRLCQRPFTMVFSGHYTALRVGTFRQQGHGMEGGWQHMEGGAAAGLAAAQLVGSGSGKAAGMRAALRLPPQVAPAFP